MEFLSNNLPLRSACLMNSKIFPKGLSTEIFTISKVTKENVKHMVEKLASHGMFFNSERNMGLYNFLGIKKLPQNSLMT